MNLLKFSEPSKIEIHPTKTIVSLFAIISQIFKPSRALIFCHNVGIAVLYQYAVKYNIVASKVSF